MTKLQEYRELAQEIEDYKSAGHSTDCALADRALSMAPAILDLLNRLEIAEQQIGYAIGEIAFINAPNGMERVLFRLNNILSKIRGE